MTVEALWRDKRGALWTLHEPLLPLLLPTRTCALLSLGRGAEDTPVRAMDPANVALQLARGQRDTAVGACLEAVLIARRARRRWGRGSAVSDSDCGAVHSTEVLL